MKRPVVINEVMYWFAFDSMGEFAFNQDFGMMRRQEWHFAVTLFRRALSIVGPFAPPIWLIKVGFTFLPWFWKIGDWFKMLAFCNQQMLSRMKTRPEEKDTSSFFLDEADKEGHSESMQNWLKGGTATVIVAGSDTTAPSLTFLSYLLAKHPEHAEKIHAELAVVDPLDLNAISVLPQLNGTINEAMRLYPVATTVVSRETLPKGIMIGDTFIPGNTKVLAPRWVIFRLKKFHLRFLPGEDGKEVLRDMRDQLTAQPRKIEAYV
ncbi:hypothetical protein OEA41_009798 [Lepraria neglecta]|uniref:Cytochrome P450 n=1 Tax=Lepraria neglecta TaxID=209136 RepID=A0AAD9YZM1_9LECA|nr:hypothetical protein OEA41_009798 [Lepraria neglecta]